MLIDRIYQKVKTFVNTEIRGNVTPAEFNLFLHDAIQFRNEQYIYDINRSMNRENKGLVTNFLENIPDRIREKVLHYHTTSVLALDTATTRTPPDDLRYIDNIELADGTFLESCRNSREFNIHKSFATEQFPVYMVSGQLIRIFPGDSGTMNISYLRKVNIPKWTYTVVSGAELFNPSANDFVDADIHPSEEDEVVRLVLMRFGINLKETDIQSFSMNKENVEFNQNNTI